MKPEYRDFIVRRRAHYKRDNAQAIVRCGRSGRGQIRSLDDARTERIETLEGMLTNWRTCRQCDGHGAVDRPLANGDTITHTCLSCQGGRMEQCGAPDPADYQPQYDATHSDRTALVEELYRLKGGRL